MPRTYTETCDNCGKKRESLHELWIVIRGTQHPGVAFSSEFGELKDDGAKLACSSPCAAVFFQRMMREHEAWYERRRASK